MDKKERTSHSARRAHHIPPRSTKDMLSRFEDRSSVSQNVPKIASAKTGRPSSASKNRFTPSSDNKCQTCGKTVYPVEKLTADDKVYHKVCFKCTQCKNTLRLGNFAALEGKLYCKPHFKQLFKIKGNYDEGFGREQRKTQWSKPEDASPTSPQKENASDNVTNTQNNHMDNVEQVQEVVNGNSYEEHRKDDEMNGVHEDVVEKKLDIDDAITDGEIIDEIPGTNDVLTNIEVTVEN